MARKAKTFIPKLLARCCGKNRYQSHQQAEKVAEEQTLLTSDLELSVYRCQCGCGDWHLTRVIEAK
jgi:hypothetical protein